MTQDRYNNLKTALYEYIKEKRPCDDLTLLTWLVSRLDEWVDHLETAFASGRIEQTDFFGMFMIGIEVIDEVKTTSEFKQAFPERDWMEFKNAATWLEKTRDREEMSLVERTYQKFKNSFVAISGENSNPEKEPGTRIDSKPSLTEGRQSTNPGGPPKIELDGPTQVEWWPRSDLLSPVELRISRALLSLAILLILGSIFYFVQSLIVRGALPGAGSLYKDISLCLFYLSVLFFAVWAALRLWFKVRRKSQK
jgi:hypothetical protein